MTILFTGNFEDGALAEWTGTLVTTGTYTASTDLAHHKLYSGKAAAAAANLWCSAYKTLPSTYTSLYFRAYCASTAAPPNANLWSWMGIGDNTGGGIGTSIAVAYIYTTGGNTRICVRNAVTATNYNTVNFPDGFVANKFYCVELYALVDDAAGIIRLWLDGALMYNITGVDTNTGATGAIHAVRAGVDSLRNSTASTSYQDCCVASDRYIGTEFQQYGRSRFVRRNRNTQFRRNDPNPYYPQYPPRPDHQT